MDPQPLQHRGSPQARLDPAALPSLGESARRRARLYDRHLTVGLWLCLVATASQTVLHLGNAATLGTEEFDAATDRNAFTWFSSVATFAVAFAALVAAIGCERRRSRYVVLAAIAAFLSVDDAIEIHERLSARIVDLLDIRLVFDSLLWPVLYAPAFVVAIWLLLKAGGVAPPRALRFIHIGIGLLVAAVAAELVSAPWSTGDNAVHTIESAIEEGAELGGWILLAAAMTVVMIEETAAGLSGRRQEREDMQGALDQATKRGRPVESALD